MKRDIFHIATQIAQNKWQFATGFFIIFTVLYSALFVLDWLPEPIVESVELSTATETSLANMVAIEPYVATVSESITEDTEAEVSEIVMNAEAATQFPDLIRIPKIEKTVAILNPESRNIADLDYALLSGVVRHPDSATMEQNGNVFILGHSSYLPNVFNKNFQAFNGVQDLVWGDTIYVESGSSVYEYRVERVYKARASEVIVPIADTGRMLTLATCNSFGSTDDRYMVEAVFVQVL